LAAYKQSKVAIRWSGTGTHHGTFLGCPLTERVIRFVGIDIIRVQDGKIVERWGEWDGLALVEQMST
jgi:predicted ester cyclase